MTYIDTVKKHALEVGLRTEIDRLRFNVTTKSFNNIETLNNGKPIYNELEESISTAEDLLQKMRLCLRALQELEPKNK
jgi:hypothetical protein